MAARAALMTRAHKRDVDKEALRESWRQQAADLGFDAERLAAGASQRQTSKTADREAPGRAPEGDGAQGPRKDTPDRAVDWAVAHLSEREAVFSRTDLLAATLAWEPGAVTIGEAEAALARLEAAGTLHAANLPVPGESLTTDRAVADERETIALMQRGRGRGTLCPCARAPSTRPLRNGPLTAGQKEAVKLIVSDRDRVVGVQGYAGSGKTTMLNRARSLLEKRGFDVKGLAPSASAAQTLANEARIDSETLQRFLARNAGVAEGRLTAGGERDMRAAFSKTVLVVDEGSLASTAQARDLLRIADTLRVPRVVLVGDEKQLDAVDAGKPFQQLQGAGMKTAVMDEIMRQREPGLKAAVEASLAGDIRGAFEKLGSNVAEVHADNLAGAAAARWLGLSAEERENTGLMAPSHALREKINAIVRERLIRDGAIGGPAVNGERLISRGYTNAEKSLAANYAPGDVVGFHRTYRRLGVEKGDELRVAGVDREAGTVTLIGKGGAQVAWDPDRLAARSGGVEVYGVDTIELRQGDRVRWTRNDTKHALVNSGTAEVGRVRENRIEFRLESGRSLNLSRDDPQLRHIDRAWASTVHAFQGRTVDRVIAATEANHPHLTTQKTFYVEISRARRRAELVTDDRMALRERLEAVTGERIAALEALERAPEKDGNARTLGSREGERTTREPERRGPDSARGAQRQDRTQPLVERTPEREKSREGPELEM